jgi:Zn-dependent protease
MVVAIVSKLGILAKLALPLLSALASLGVYAALFGWQFGIGILALLLAHEMGHVIAIRAKGLPASLPIFVPLLGAAIFMHRMPQSAKDEAEIAVAGPLAGAAASVACYAVYTLTSWHLWLALAYFSFFINLLNLLPVSPLDGGRIASAISRWLWPIGLALVIVLFVYTWDILYVVIAWLGLMRTIQVFRRSDASALYYRVPLRTRISFTVLYVVLAGLLAGGMLQSQLALAGNPYGLMLNH